ncbi:MAG: 5-formyltetrahydrofolate cyclo-ligase [Thermodesulfobacteriota bacterium]
MVGEANEQEKAKLRSQLIAQRLEQLGREEKSLAIQRRFLHLGCFRRSRTVALYWSFRGEVDTELIFEAGWKRKKELLLPVIQTQEGLLTFRKVRYREELIPGRYGIMVPPCEADRVVPLESIDLMVVPGVGFDLTGVRLGYGGGYYDRTLTRLLYRTKKLALAFDVQMVNSLPLNSTDVKVDMVITESRVVVFSDDKDKLIEGTATQRLPGDPGGEANWK